MKSSKLLWISALGVLGLLALYFGVFSDNSGPAKASESPEAVNNYKRNLSQQRSDKDVFLRTSADSPLENKSTFKGLTYFEPSIDYRVTARFEPFADKTQKLVIQLSDGSEEVYEKYGHAVFKLQGEVCRLLILKHDEVYSILFRDKTTGKQTYGGGRYLDLESANFTGNEVMIDFNKAYHPYCVYNHNYACPLPPAENTLPISVEAGEKL